MLNLPYFFAHIFGGETIRNSDFQITTCIKNSIIISRSINLNKHFR